MGHKLTIVDIKLFRLMLHIYTVKNCFMDSFKQLTTFGTVSKWNEHSLKECISSTAVSKF